eukprot:TRINITY_DN12523_c0_g1_i1.p1 TRINITY_DN12523_c0_g1~~TRINITY_DN12523_c0_g1_i1.p1  ORF type:complete len:250 (+),score=55.60 TRINITY_DN12523_c0_g1_i1:33-752(+)
MDIGRKDDHHNAKRKGKSRKGVNGGRVRLEGPIVTKGSTVFFRYYVYDKEQKLHRLGDFVDEFGLESREMRGLDKKGNWNLIPRLEKKAKQTMADFKANKLEEPLVLLQFTKASPEQSYFDRGTAVKTQTTNLEQEKGEEYEEEYEIVTTRSGRKVVPVGSRSQKQEFYSQKCGALSTLMGGAELEQDLMVYFVYDTSRHIIEEYTYCGCKYCRMSWYETGRNRGIKKKKVLQSQLEGL